jgi:hypothetical protein
MDDAVLVSGLERDRYLPCDRHGFVERDASLGDPIRERGSINELEDEELRLLGISDLRLGIRRLGNVIQRADVRMVQLRNQLGFALKPRDAIRVVDKCVRQHFYGHVPIQPRIARAIHFAHSAFAQLGEDVIRTQHLPDDHFLIPNP